MPAHQDYFPTRHGDQIPWLKNYRNKIGSYQTAGGFTSAEIAAQVADADFVLILLETWLAYIAAFSQSATAYVQLICYGPLSTTISAVPLFNGNPTVGPPPLPAWPTIVAPGALLRIFAFIAAMKKKPFYTHAIGEDLGLIGPEAVFDPSAVPPVKSEALSGSVEFVFKKRAPTESKSHMGVWFESQLEGEADFSFLAIDTSSPYNDTRPLKVAGKPEKRRYRLCFWDGEPTRVWTDVIEVTFGG